MVATWNWFVNLDGLATILAIIIIFLAITFGIFFFASLFAILLGFKLYGV